MSDDLRRLRFDLCYDGTDFEGWQRQPRRRTVQGEFERVLSRIAGDRPVSVRGVGRTDSGVHARRYVADALMPRTVSEDSLRVALERMLPDDLRPLGLCEVPESFHSRLHARAKTYRYQLDLGAVADPFRRRYALHLRQRPDAAAMRDALERLPGRRDWSGFAGSKCEVEDRVRTLTEARLVSEGESSGWLVFTADGFLTYMVRNLVGTLLEIGRGRFEAERIDEVLATGDRDLAGPTAPPHGLWLWEIDYDESAATVPLP